MHEVQMGEIYMPQVEGRRYFDLAVIIPLEEEWHTVSSVFPLDEDLSDDNSTRFTVETGNAGVSMLLVKQDGMGRAHSYSAAYKTVNDFSIGLLMSLGIAGSLNSDLKLGDVCYTGKVVDVYDNTKTTDKGRNFKVSFSPVMYDSERPWIRAVDTIRIAPDLKQNYSDWQNEQAKFLNSLRAGLDTKQLDSVSHIEAPNSCEVTIACAAVSDSKSYNRELKALDRKISAIETEAGGVFDVALKNQIPAFQVRGISDFAESKGQLEKDTKGIVRTFAARNAATFLKVQIRNPNFVRQIVLRRKALNISTAFGEHFMPLNSLASVVNELAEGLYSRMKELSQEYRVQPRGYRLPVPRIRQMNLGLGSVEQSSEPLEIRDVVRAKRHAFIQIPRTYPDSSLPLVVADDILSLEGLNQQCIPVVIDGSSLNPAAKTLQKSWPFEVSGIDLSSVQIVYVIHNIPFGSKTRLAYLKAQMENEVDAKFVFISNDDLSVIQNADISSISGMSYFKLVPTSFLEITHFVQKNYEMTGSEAEVIALRLKEIFSKYRLAAHPTYFAALSRPALAALLHANRRAELIQIAVDGLLSFIVATDKSDITLSRSTRLRFLRYLALEIHVNNKTFSKSELVSYAETMSRDHDWGIDSLTFISAFVDKGIIAFHDNSVVFSLPYVEAYVLARELVSHSDKAISYFSDSGSEFKSTVLDLYAEIDPSIELVRKIVSNLKAASGDLPSNNDNYILSDKLRPALLSKPERLEVLQKKIRSASDDILTGKSKSREKQQLLDIMDHAAEQVQSATRPNEASYNEGAMRNEPNSVEVAMRAWQQGTIILGSGAEHLTAPTKLELSELLIRIGAQLIHAMTVTFSEYDYTVLKEKVREDIKSEMEADNNAVLNGTLEEQVDGIVDFIQYICMTMPYGIITLQLCENARLKILGNTLEKTQTTFPAEKLLHAAWFADVDANKGQPSLVKVIKDINPSPFLRTIIVSHILMRVHWSHAKQEDRLLLLEAADFALKSVNPGWKKDSLMRMLKSEKVADRNSMD